MWEKLQKLRKQETSPKAVEKHHWGDCQECDHAIFLAGNFDEWAIPGLNFLLCNKRKMVVITFMTTGIKQRKAQIRQTASANHMLILFLKNVFFCVDNLEFGKI